MSRFTGSLIIEEVEPGRRWRLVEAIRYEAGVKGSGRLIIVPERFETDGATLPAALRTVLAVWGTYGRAACLHDYLYDLLRTGAWRRPNVFESCDIHPAFAGAGLDGRSCDERAERARARRWADAEFRTAMLACGTGRLLAGALWFAVRIFGARHARPIERPVASPLKSW